MLSPFPRPGLNPSALVGLLAELALHDHPPQPPCFVQGLSAWLDWKVAIPLSAALQRQPLTRETAVPPGCAQTVAGAEAEFMQVRQVLELAIADAVGEALAEAQTEPAAQRREGAVAGAERSMHTTAFGTSFAPFRRCFFSLQQAMERAVGPLRTQLRKLVQHHGGPEGARLAALDGAWADALAAREQALLAQLPLLLDKHFTRLRQQAVAIGGPASASASVINASPDDLAPGGTPPAWLARFSHDMHRLLQAELDLRLQPAQGLLDTLRAPQLHT
jgi:hypothetical protein